jgi:hypothetical protein
MLLKLVVDLLASDVAPEVIICLSIHLADAEGRPALLAI